MIRSFRHHGLEAFFLTGTKAGVQPQHAPRLRLQLARLETARQIDDVNLPSWRLHRLRGKLADHWAIWVDKNWRLTFVFENGDAALVDYVDYH